MQTRNRPLPKPVTSEPKAATGGRVLLERHIRPNGDYSVVSCSICCESFVFKNAIPSLAQCVVCKNVCHMVCLDKVMRLMSDDGETITCPHCRAQVAAENLDVEWNADDVVNRIEEEGEEEFHG